MNKFTKTAILITACGMLAASFCACDSSDSTDSSGEESIVKESAVSADAATLKKTVVGEWGRLDEPMHYFYSDMTCVIGGMQGTYDINEECALVLTTMSGSVTTYEWAMSSTEAQGENYWYLDGDTITINGNCFTKIAGEETKDQAE